MPAHGVAAPVVMKIGGWKNSSTMDIYLRLSGVDVKGATDCLKLTPSNISFGDNVIKLENFKKLIFTKVSQIYLRYLFKRLARLLSKWLDSLDLY